MTPTRSVVSGLERLAGTPALIHGRTVLTGADVLRGRGMSGDALTVLHARLAATRQTGEAAREPGALVDRLRLAYGDGVCKVAVCADYAGAGGDAALAAWAAGAAVVCGHDVLSPAKMLALLERTGTDRAFAPAELLLALPEHPSALLTDLSALSTVVYCAHALTGHQSSLIAQGLGVTVSHVTPTALRERAPQGTTIPTPDPVDAARTAAARAADGVDLAEAARAVHAVGRASLLSMLDALHRAGLFTSPIAAHTEDEILTGARVAERHRGLVRRWLSVLAAEGLLHRHGSHLRPALAAQEFTGPALDRVWDEADKAWRATAGSADTVAYARRSARHLLGLLSGGISPVSLLFPQGSTALAESLYRESVTARYQHHAAGGLLGAVAGRHPRHRPLRVLEVGAGTGATTERALPALTASGADIAYLFTDVTPFFLERARQRWGAVPGVAFGRLDIDTSAREQGFAPGSFDVVLAGGVLNAARDTDASLRSLAGLLAPDGWLILTEPTTEEYWVMITQAFMMTDAQDARARTGATFLSLAQWHAALDATGLRRVVDLPERDHPLDSLGHRVFAARRSPV